MACELTGRYGHTCSVRDGFEYAIAIESVGESGQDRATAVQFESQLAVVLADGAGGTTHGSGAAKAVVDAVSQNPAACADAGSLLDTLDDPVRLHGGQTTAVIAVLSAENVAGASVGDSGAWIIGAHSIADLTRSQQRKPLLGAGCVPVSFENPFPAGSTLLVASDGLLRYAKSVDIARIARDRSLEAAGKALIELVRLPSGKLQDDVAVVLCRRR
jgi:serine/threonine protein phosphatase PrpC